MIIIGAMSYKNKHCFIKIHLHGVAFVSKSIDNMKKKEKEIQKQK